MRAGASGLQQTLTSESASVLKNAVAEACRRGHAQVTPLHVAATLLSTHGSLLREACLRTHQTHSSSLPQCRALELCFNIAVERLQSAQCLPPDGQPSYNNALVVALKRAQAHQRRGCPEQQQQPLLAVKVELEQLVMSILVDPSVSKVMREAGFSSTDVKNHIEEFVMSTTPQPTPITISAADQQSQMSVLDQMNFKLGGGPIPEINRPLLHTRPTFNTLCCDMNGAILPLQPRPSLVEWPPVQAVSSLSKSVGFGGGAGGGAAGATTAATHTIAGESKHVLDVFLQRKRRNPLLVGETSANVDAVLRHVIHRVERGDVPDQLKGVKVLSLKLTPLSVLSATRDELKLKFMELDESVQELKKGGVIIHLGDLQWLLQLRRSSVISARSSIEFCAVTYAVQEISDLLARHNRTGNGRLWLMGSATNHTFYGFQSQHSCLENEWELQLVPINPSSRLNISKNKICENGGEIIDSSLTLSLHPFSAVPSKGILLDGKVINEVKELRCSSDCMVNSEKEALCVHEHERDAAGSPPCFSSVETPNTDGALTSTFQSALPAWLQNAIQNSTTNKHECKTVQDHPISLHVDTRIQSVHSRQMAPVFPPASADNSFWRRKDAGMGSALQKCATERNLFGVFKKRIEDLTGCSPAKVHLGQQLEQVEKGRTPHVQRDNDPVTGKALDVDALGRLCKGLAERVGWQKSVISAVATTIMQCRSVRTKRQRAGFKSDAWLLLLGPDRAGKQKMAEALAELIFGCEKNPVFLQLGHNLKGLGPVPSRGKMPLDRVADAVRQNPSSLVLMLEDVEQMDVVCRLGLVKAMEKGRLQDSSGREVSLNSAIVLLASSIGSGQSTISKLEVNNGDLKDLHSIYGEDMVSLSKRKSEITCHSHKKIRLMGRALSLDLNLSTEECEEDGSTTQCTAMTEKATEDPTNDERVLLAARTHLKEFYDLVDATVIFSPVPASVAVADSL